MTDTAIYLQSDHPAGRQITGRRAAGRRNCALSADHRRGPADQYQARQITGRLYICRHPGGRSPAGSDAIFARVSAFQIKAGICTDSAAKHRTRSIRSLVRRLCMFAHPLYMITHTYIPRMYAGRGHDHACTHSRDMCTGTPAGTIRKSFVFRIVT